MSTHACCVIPGFSGDAKAATRIAGSGPRFLTRTWRRWFEIARCALPLGILALLPKCPVCIVAYVAAASGIGISIAAAAYFRIGLLLVCSAPLAYFVIRRGLRFSAQRKTCHGLT